ncbi:MAG TPA: hypothetical protein VF163_20205 [Micromonosporaceae bacterium]
MQPDDSYWRRPDPGDAQPPPAPPLPPAPPVTANVPAAEDPAARLFAPDGREQPRANAGPAPTGQSGLGAGPNRYTGPPAESRPPAGWQTPRVIEPAPPRRLPDQDHASIDQAEAQARTTTFGLTILAGAVMMVLLCTLCGRWLF